MNNKLISFFITLSILVSSIITPVEIASANMDQSNIKTIMDVNEKNVILENQEGKQNEKEINEKNPVRYLSNESSNRQTNDEEEKLTYQNLKADIYTDSSYSKKDLSDTSIKISGNLPKNTKVKAYPVEAEIEDKKILSAFDITIFDQDDNEYKISSENEIKVQITNQKIKKAKKVEVFHKENENAKEEKVSLDIKNDDTVIFMADGFSIYIVTEPEVKTTTFIFLNRNEQGQIEVWNEQKLRNGEKLIEPKLPIFLYKGTFQGWYYYDKEINSFGDKVDFTMPIEVNDSSTDVVYINGKFQDVLYTKREDNPTENLRVNDTITLPEPQSINTESNKFLGSLTTENGKDGKIFKPGDEVLITNENTNAMLFDDTQETKQITFQIQKNYPGLDYAYYGYVRINVTYKLNGEDYEYNEKELKIKHGDTATIELPANAQDVKFEAIPEDDFFHVTKISPERLDGTLDNYYSNNENKLKVNITLIVDQFTFDANIDSIYSSDDASWIKSIKGFTIYKNDELVVTKNKDNSNEYYNNPYALEDRHRPKGFDFIGWSKTPDGNNIVDYKNGTKLKDIVEDRLYAVWSKPKKFNFIIEKEDPNYTSEINITVKLNDYYFKEVNFPKVVDKASLNAPTSSQISEILVNNSLYNYEMIKPEQASTDGKYDIYNYRIVIKNIVPVPTGISDNISPTILALAIAILTLAFNLYSKFRRAR